MKAADRKALAACLVPLLDALGLGSGAEAALRNIEMEDIGKTRDLLNAMAALGFTHREARLGRGRLAQAVLPCLALLPDGEVLVVLRSDGDDCFAYSGKSGRYERREAPGRTARLIRFFPTSGDGYGAQSPASRDWFWETAGRFGRNLAICAVFSLALGCLSLLYPVLMTAMYARLPAASAARFVISLACGAILYLVAEAGLRFLRGALLDYSSARFGQAIGAEIYRRLLSFQASFTETAPIESQVRRIRDFETIAAFVSGPAVSSVFDLPFILFNLAWLASAGPRFVLAPLVTIAVFAAGALLLYPRVKAAQIAYSAADGARHDVFSRLVAARAQLMGGQARASWTERFSEASRSAALAGYRLQKANGLVSALATLAVTLGGLATLFFGILDVIAGRARADSLVAAMLLVWRVLEPVRSAFVVVTQIDSVRKSVSQARRFLSLPLELPSLAPKSGARRTGGELAFAEVFFRYGSEGYPALSGLSVAAGPGSVLAISGHEGAGKTTIAKLALALYRPQSGTITLGGLNIQQMDPAALRRGIAYAPAQPVLFPGSVLANLRLGAPETSERDIAAMTERLGLAEALAARGWQLSTRLELADLEGAPYELCRLVTVTRALARKAQVLILDEPERGLPASSLAEVAALVAERREDGDTVLVLTNDPGLEAAADRTARLDSGRLGPARARETGKGRRSTP